MDINSIYYNSTDTFTKQKSRKDFNDFNKFLFIIEEELNIDDHLRRVENQNVHYPLIV